MEKDEDSVDRELRRVRGLVALMRDTGVAELNLGADQDAPGLHVRLGPRPQAVEPLVRVDADEAEELSDEARAARAIDDAERAHNRMWSRITRSSGAPIPPFQRPK